MVKKLIAGGRYFDVTQNQDGSWSLSLQGSPQPLLKVGTLDEIVGYVTHQFGVPTWLP